MALPPEVGPNVEFGGFPDCAVQVPDEGLVALKIKEPVPHFILSVPALGFISDAILNVEVHPKLSVTVTLYMPLLKALAEGINTSSDVEK